MTVEQPSVDLVAEFDGEVDVAALQILENFEWLGLPSGDQLEDLHVELSDAISAVLKTWL